VFTCQRLCQRHFHHPFEFLERVKIVSQPVVVDDPPIFKLIRCNNGVVTLIEQLCSMDGLVSPHVSLALFLHYRLWNTETDIPIDPAVSSPVFVAVLLTVTLESGHLVSQECGRLTPCVGDQ